MLTRKIDKHPQPSHKRYPLKTDPIPINKSASFIHNRIISPCITPNPPIAPTNLPGKKHFGIVLDLGCQGDRHATYLSEQKAIECDIYYSFIISKNRLQLLLKFTQEKRNFFPSVDLKILNQPIIPLPLATHSVDLAISSSVFQDLNPQGCQNLRAEIHRVLKPEGVLLLMAQP